MRRCKAPWPRLMMVPVVVLHQIRQPPAREAAPLPAGRRSAARAATAPPAQTAPAPAAGFRVVVGLNRSDVDRVRAVAFKQDVVAHAALYAGAGAGRHVGCGRPVAAVLSGAPSPVGQRVHACPGDSGRGGAIAVVGGTAPFGGSTVAADDVASLRAPRPAVDCSGPAAGNGHPAVQ